MCLNHPLQVYVLGIGPSFDAAGRALLTYIQIAAMAPPPPSGTYSPAFFLPDLGSASVCQTLLKMTKGGGNLFHTMDMPTDW